MDDELRIGDETAGTSGVGDGSAGRATAGEAGRDGGGGEGAGAGSGTEAEADAEAEAGAEDAGVTVGWRVEVEELADIQDRRALPRKRLAVELDMVSSRAAGLALFLARGASGGRLLLARGEAILA